MDFFLDLLFRLIGPVMVLLGLMGIVYFFLYLFGLLEPDHFDF